MGFDRVTAQPGFGGPRSRRSTKKRSAERRQFNCRHTLSVFRHAPNHRQPDVVVRQGEILCPRDQWTEGCETRSPIVYDQPTADAVTGVRYLKAANPFHRPRKLVIGACTAFTEQTCFKLASPRPGEARYHPSPQGVAGRCVPHVALRTRRGNAPRESLRDGFGWLQATHSKALCRRRD